MSAKHPTIGLRIGSRVTVNFDRAQPRTLSPEVRSEISEAVSESRLRRYADELFEKALLEDDDGEAASAVFAETQSWFRPD